MDGIEQVGVRWIFDQDIITVFKKKKKAKKVTVVE